MHEEAVLMPDSNKKFLQAGRWLPLIIWMAVIAIFSTDDFSSESTSSILEPVIKIIMGNSYTPAAFDTIHHIIRKSAHVTEYAILAALWFRVLNPGLIRWRVVAAGCAFSFSVTYSVLDEIHQSFTKNRGGNAVDVMIDSAGVLLSLSIIWLFNKCSKRVKCECK